MRESELFFSVRVALDPNGAFRQDESGCMCQKADKEANDDISSRRKRQIVITNHSEVSTGHIFSNLSSSLPPDGSLANYGSVARGTVNEEDCRTIVPWLEIGC